jgi:hypothetical protein
MMKRVGVGVVGEQTGGKSSDDKLYEGDIEN